MSNSSKKKELSFTGKVIQNGGGILGVTVALGVMLAMGFSGALPGAAFGAIGGLVGSLVAMPIAAMFPTEPS